MSTKAQARYGGPQLRPTFRRDLALALASTPEPWPREPHRRHHRTRRLVHASPAGRRLFF